MTNGFFQILVQQSWSGFWVCFLLKLHLMHLPCEWFFFSVKFSCKIIRANNASLIAQETEVQFPQIRPKRFFCICRLLDKEIPRFCLVSNFKSSICSRKPAKSMSHLVNTNQHWNRNVKTRIGLRCVWDMLNLKCWPRPCTSYKNKNQNKINKVSFCSSKKKKEWPLLALNWPVFIEHLLKIITDNELGAKIGDLSADINVKLSVAFQKRKKNSCI